MLCITSSKAATRTLQKLKVAAGIPKTHKTSLESEGAEHVFEISTETLAWKQYFDYKKVHGKRAAIPHVQESINSAVRCVFRALLTNLETL